MRMLAEVLQESMLAFVAVTFLMLIFLIVWTILGLHMFGSLTLDSVYPNFNTFMNSFMAVFQVCFGSQT